MFCEKCGNAISDNAKFCAKCGTPVETLTQEIPKEMPIERMDKTMEQKSRALYEYEINVQKNDSIV